MDTTMNNESTAIIDWISFTLPTAYSWQALALGNSVHPIIMDLFGVRTPNGNTALGKGKWYRERHTINSVTGRPLIHVYLDPVAENNAGTSTFSVTGFALSSHPDALQHLDPVELLRKVKELGGRLTRIDLAFDYRGELPILSNMFDASHPEVWRDRIITPLRFDKPLPVGWDQETIYYGHLDKGTCIAAYDKAQQQDVPGQWTRIEFRTKDRDLCSLVLQELAAGSPVGAVTAALLRKYLKFVPPGRKAKYQRETCVWWDRLLTAGSGYALQRHHHGKQDDQPRKRGPTPAAFHKHMLDALKHDDTGTVERMILAMSADIQARKK